MNLFVEQRVHRPRLIMLAAVLFALLGFAVVAFPSDELENVEFAISDGWGNPILTRTQIALTPVGGLGETIYFTYREDHAVHIPSGNYVVVVDARGFMRHAMNLEVDASRKVLVSICLNLALIETTPVRSICTVEGRISKRGLGKRRTGVRLVGVYCQCDSAAPVDAEGRFRIAELKPGRYSLMVYKDDLLDSTRFVDVRCPVQRIELDPPPAK